MTQNAGYLPSRIIAGETIWVSASNTAQDWSGTDLFFDNYLPATHALTYSFSAPTPISVTAVSNNMGTGWTLTVTAAQTLLWKSGQIRYTALATEVGENGKSFAVDSGVIVVDASPLAVSAYAAALTAIDAAIATHATDPQRSISIGDMSVTYDSVEELIALRQYVVWLVQQDTGKRIKRIIRTRFI